MADLEPTVNIATGQVCSIAVKGRRVKTNWNPSKVAFVDFETQSTVDLTKTGAKKYAADPSTKVAVAVMRIDGEDLVWTPYDDGKERFIAASEGRTLVAHNAPFDSAIWNHCVGVEREWFDTLPPARACGLPGRLELLGQIFQGRGKDPIGKRLIDMLSKVRVVNGTPQYAVANPFVWNQFLEYCRTDVDLLESVFSHVQRNLEPEVLNVDRVINDRGIPVDLEFADKIFNLSAWNETKSSGEFSELTGGVNPKSSKQVLKFVNDLGFSVKAVNKVALQELLNNPDAFHEGEDCPDDVARLIEAVRL
jgi:DNA polymerase